ncbi:MAG: helix-turn-helix domain-containing protein [Bacteroidota bacterium]
MESLLIVAIVQALIACYLLWDDVMAKRPERFLLAFLAFQALHLSIKFYVLKFVGDGALFHHFPTSISLAYGPLIYLYVRSKSQHQTPTRKVQLLHLSPFIVCSIFYLGIASALSVDQISAAWTQLYTKLASVCILLSLIGYFGFLQYQLSVKESPEKWLRLPIGLSLLTIATVFLTYLFSLEVLLFRYLGLVGTIVWVVSILKNSVLLKTKVASITPEEAVNRKEEEIGVNAETSDLKPHPKYEKSGLSLDQAYALIQQLEEIMEVDKVYLNPQLTLKELADQLKISKHYVTEVLNTYLEQNFYQFVNAYRVEEAKRRIESNAGTNLLEIAFASGFQSKGTFNTYFKLLVGTTPSQYRRRILATAIR